MKLSRIQKQTEKGFTLVELAIVLVIIGLLVGGVLAGQDLIKSAKLQKGVKQITELNTATNTFQTKYGQLPGDYTNGNQLTTPVAITGIPAAATLGLGDGNSLVQAVTTAAGGTATAFVGVSGETAAFFPELYDAGLWAEAMVATDVTTVTPATTAINKGTFATFAAESPSGLLIVQGFPGVAAAAQGNYIFIVGQATGAGVAGIAPLGRGLTPLSAQSIDAKLDDGNPGQGSITSLAAAPVPGTLDAYNATGCANSAASYNIGLKTQQCTLGIKASF